MRSCVLAVCLLSSFTSTGYGDAAEEKALEFVKKIGGHVVQVQYHEKPGRKFVGKPVLRIELDRTKFADEGMKELAALKRFQELSLVGTGITDAGLKELTALKAVAIPFSQRN